MVKIAVLVSGSGTNLQAIIDAKARGLIKDGELSLVISNKKEAYALERAKNAGIKAVFVPKLLKQSREEYTGRLLEILKEHDIGLVVFAGFMLMLSENLTKAFQNRMINVHPALIPSFCGEGFYGLKVHEAALEYGVKLTGATVHFVNEITDGGPVILQKAIEVQDGDTAESLQKRVMEQCEWELLPKAIDLFCAGRLTVDGRRVIIKN